MLFNWIGIRLHHRTHSYIQSFSCRSLARPTRRSIVKSAMMIWPVISRSHDARRTYSRLADNRQEIETQYYNHNTRTLQLVSLSRFGDSLYNREEVTSVAAPIQARRRLTSHPHRTTIARGWVIQSHNDAQINALLRI